MLNRLETILHRDCQLDSRQSVLLGVSGGADSLCLFDLMHQLDYKLVIAHLDHGIRTQSRQDSQTVERLAGQLGLPFVHERIDTPVYAQKFSLSLEEAARDVRYRFLFEQAEIHGVQAVAVAHNADDQVETILMHLLRGTGLDGLSGMRYRITPNAWSSQIPIIRPLLSTWRTEIETYCQERGLEPIIDHTNLDTKYFRNRLRHELIPELETYVPKVRQRLFQTANLLSADRQVLDEIVDQSWEKLVIQIHHDHIILHLPTYHLQPLGIKRRLIRKAIACLRPGARDVDFALVQRMIDFAENPTATRQTDIGLGLYAFLENQTLVLAAWEANLPITNWPQLGKQVSGIRFYHQPPTTNLDLGYGWQLTTELFPGSANILETAHHNDDPYQAWINLGNQQASLNIRTRRPGDRFQPLGMNGSSMKLSDFMINVKMPRRAREHWPLVCLGDEIIWVPGYRLAHPYRLTGESENILFLALTRQSL